MGVGTVCLVGKTHCETYRGYAVCPLTQISPPRVRAVPGICASTYGCWRTRRLVRTTQTQGGRWASLRLICRAIKINPADGPLASEPPSAPRVAQKEAHSEDGGGVVTAELTARLRSLFSLPPASQPVGAGKRGTDDVSEGSCHFHWCLHIYPRSAEKNRKRDGWAFDKKETWLPLLSHVPS